MKHLIIKPFDLLNTIPLTRTRTMRVPKRSIVFQFKNENRKTNFMCLNHSFSKMKMKMKNKIER